MKKVIAITTLIVQVLVLSAQVMEGIKPASVLYSGLFGQPLKEVLLPAFKLEEAEKQDKADEKNGTFPKFSRSVYTNLNPGNSGQWTDVPGGRVWRLQVTSTGAYALIPYYNKFYLPAGATLHVYTPGGSQVIGAFTAANNPANGYYCTGIIQGESCILEYFEPIAVRGQGIINLNEMGHAYRPVNLYLPAASRSTQENLGFGSSDPCEVNINCSEGANWQNQKNSVVCILITSGGSQGFCTGSMINNVRMDCTPFLLSASHCDEGTTANEFSQWEFYYNFESPGCTDPATIGTLSTHFVTGCTVKAKSFDDGGDAGSDFLLLQLNNHPASAYNAYYEGWDANPAAPTGGVSIHHPNADIKKISTYTTTPASATWGGIVDDTHWEVTWAATTNGHGVTEPGSSGSPLYNQNGLVVGTLTGGNSYCNDPNSPDSYGKVAYHWVSNGASNLRQLKPWLDPDNTGILTMNGSPSPCPNALTDDAGIQYVEAPVSGTCATTITPKVVLRNYGTNTLTSVTIPYRLDAVEYQYLWSGSLSANSVKAITLPAIAVAEGVHTFYAETFNPNGAIDNQPANNGKTVQFNVVSSAAALNLSLHTDRRGAQTTWEIIDAAGAVVAAGGPYQSISGGEQFDIPVCVGDGCYKFALYDENGDGMSAGSYGNFQLTGPGGAPVYAEMGSNHNFGRWKSYSFCVGGAAVSELPTIQIDVRPNPSAGLFNIAFNSTEAKVLKIYDVLGNIISTTHNADAAFVLDLTMQPRGIYFLQVETLTGKALKKLVVE